MSSYHESFWRSRARTVIVAVLAELPPDTEVNAKRIALSRAYPFGERKNNKYRVWLDEIQVQLGHRPPADKRGWSRKPSPDQLSLFEGEA